MNFNRLLKILIVLTFLLTYAIPVGAQEPTVEPTVVPTVEPTVEPTVAPTVEPTVEPTVAPTVEPTVEPTVAPTVEPTVEPTVAPTVEPTVEPTVALTVEPTIEPTVAPTVEPTIEITPTLQSEGSGTDVEAAAVMPGTYTTHYIAMYNLGTQDSSPIFTLYQDPTQGSSSQTIPVSTIKPGGVTIVDGSSLPTGKYSGVIQSSSSLAVVAQTENLGTGSAWSADAYTGISNPTTVVYAPYIFNNHSNWDTQVTCQNAGGSSATITAEFYRMGESIPRATLSSSAPVDVNKLITWRTDQSTFQSQWAGGLNQFGWAKFSSVVPIACVVMNERTSATPRNMAMYAAVPVTFAAKNVSGPIVFRSHGGRTGGEWTAWNTGIAIINTGGSPGTVTVNYAATNSSFTQSCSIPIPGNGAVNWLAPQMGTGQNAGVGWTCTGTIPDNFPSTTLGSVTVVATQDVLVALNHNRYDARASSASGVGVGASYFNVGLSSANTGTKAVCPLGFYDSTTSGWVSGPQALNLDTSVSTQVTWKQILPNTDPSQPANYRSVTDPNSIAPGKASNFYLPNQSGTFGANWKGAIVVQTNPPVKIGVIMSTTGYNSYSAAEAYNCIPFD